MKNASIVFIEAVVIADYPRKQLIVLSQIRSSGEEPTIAETSLPHIKSRIAFHEEPWRSFSGADIFGSLPLKVSFCAAREVKAFIRRWKLGILKKSASFEALFSNVIEVLNTALTAQTAFFLAEL